MNVKTKEEQINSFLFNMSQEEKDILAAKLFDRFGVANFCATMANVALDRQCTKGFNYRQIKFWKAVEAAFQEAEIKIRQADNDFPLI